MACTKEKEGGLFNVVYAVIERGDGGIFDLTEMWVWLERLGGRLGRCLPDLFSWPYANFEWFAYGHDVARLNVVSVCQPVRSICGPGAPGCGEP